MGPDDRAGGLPGGAALAHLRAAARAAATGRARAAWFVGGCVRDALLGRACTDLDVVVADDPQRFAERSLAFLRRAGGRTRAGMGCLDAEVGAWRVASEGAVLDVLPLEGDLEADLARRDLTINGMAVPVLADSMAELVDPHGGQADLRSRVLRVVSPRNLETDPVRMLRIARFAVQLGFTVHAETREWIVPRAGLLAAAPGERIAYELMRTFGGDGSARMVHVLEDLGLLPVLFPDLLPLAGLYQGGYHHLDAYEHSVEALRIADALLAGDDAGVAGALAGGLRDAIQGGKLPWVRSRPALARLGALLHDVGKPAAHSTDPDGRVRFRDHGQLGARGMALLGERLRLSRAERHYLTVVVREHMRPCLLAMGDGASERALGRFLRDVGPLAPDVCLVSLADRLAARGPATTEAILRGQLGTIERIVALWQASNAGGVSSAPLLGGLEVMALLDLPPGPDVGRVLGELRAAQLSGEVRSRDEAARFVRRRGAGAS